MAYQCKEPCLPPPIDAAQCSGDAQDSCTLIDMDQRVQTCDSAPREACRASDRLSYQTKQPCAGLPFRVGLCPMAISIPCASPCLSLHTEMCAGSPSVPCGTVAVQPGSPTSTTSHPCSMETADTCAPPSPLTGGSSCLGHCSGLQAGGGMSYVIPGSTVCLEPSGCVSVKPRVSSPEMEDTTMFLASYQPHFV